MGLTPPKTNMTMIKQPFEDVSPIKSGDFPMSLVFRGAYIRGFLIVRYISFRCKAMGGIAQGRDDLRHLGANKHRGMLLESVPVATHFLVWVYIPMIRNFL